MIPFIDKKWARAIPGIVASATLFVCLDDGTRIPFKVQADDEQMTLQAAQTFAPSAVSGFSSTIEAKYKQAPHSIGKNQSMDRGFNMSER